MTSRIRRVKCDEERPFCQRCKTFGVSCDGYPDRNIIARPKKAAPRALLPRAVKVSYFANEEEHRYFDIFCSSTSLEILPGLDTGSTRRTLLQLCHATSSIRHAIIAIGALDKTNSSTPQLSRWSPDDMEWRTQANRHHDAALKQYSEAVSHMKKEASSAQNSLRTTLLGCLLIVCFEAWNGNLKLAVGQVQAAIALILEWKAQHGSLNNARLSPEPSVIEADLIQIFCRLAIQTVFFGFELSAPSRALLAAEGRSLVQAMPSVFTSLREAATFHQSLIRRGTYTFSSYLRTHRSFMTQTVPPELLVAQAEFQADSLKWFQAFDPLLKSPLTGHSLRFARLMKLQLLVSYAYASTALSNDEAVHEKYRDSFHEAVQLTEEVLTDRSWTKDSKPANYCFDSRVVMPLWMAGLNSRDDTIRRKAVKLLLEFPRREGIWDSICAGKMVQWVAKLEEEFRGPEGRIPEWARIRDFSWINDFEKRTAVLSCRQMTCSVSSTIEEETGYIFW
ncbi:hypothetical protein ONS96_004801 [Cadophora gregata f. sp. sojae]|nr:hypothetical protein ONS96_004801 [Cadophora gregata f. sp. sojae]